MTMHEALDKAMRRDSTDDAMAALREGGIAMANEDSMSQAIHDVYCGIVADHQHPNEKDREQARQLIAALGASNRSDLGRASQLRRRRGSGDREGWVHPVISSDLSPLPDTEVHYLRSNDEGDKLKILVGHSGPAESGPRSVLFMGDPWANFGTAVEIVRLLHLSGDIPPLLVVAVGYRVATLEDNFPLRTRDFSPVVDQTSARAGSDEMGGASQFLAFFRDRLKPWVRDTYRVDTDDAALFGFSLGGLFATYVLFNEPAMFRRYGIGSPCALLGRRPDVRAGGCLRPCPRRSPGEGPCLGRRLREQRWRSPLARAIGAGSASDRGTGDRFRGSL